MKKAIIGNGGFAREVYFSMQESDRKNLIFFVEDSYYSPSTENQKPLSQFDPKEYQVVIAIGDSKVRKRIVGSLPSETKYFTHIHPSVILLDQNIEIGEGSIICAGSILTTNIKIKKHSQINLMTTIGHDCNIGEFFTTAPGAKISGNCNIGDNVYIGTNASVKQKIKICSDVTVGMNATVVHDILKSGTYVGTPSKQLEK